MDELREQLCKVLIGFPKDVAEAIEALIDAKIVAAIDDLRNEINKTGIYDPGW